MAPEKRANETLKQKLQKVEDTNKLAALAISRTKLSLNRLRVEYSILIESLESKCMAPNEELSDLSDLEVNDGKDITKKRKLNNGSGVGSSLSPSSEGTLASARERDPDLPKRPLNPYLIFCDMEKDNFKKKAESEGKSIDLSKTLGEAWKLLTDDDKKEYNSIYREEKKKYNEEMKLYEEKKRNEELAKSLMKSHDSNSKYESIMNEQIEGEETQEEEEEEEDHANNENENENEEEAESQEEELLDDGEIADEEAEDHDEPEPEPEQELDNDDEADDEEAVNGEGQNPEVEASEETESANEQ
ncbi:hypothetical protein WICPIJ_005756 [Wickerhamomyces pijperi]|uniref:HMG box domain-containing protein n=1 Tax=Wickerhamomyces pijperi TaxID=599730 RepID=A0A9P8TM22_WICPI|nr:hypothetical protein WICPIJ_005756 [Wickerhamomyces pijperi]